MSDYDLRDLILGTGGTLITGAEGPDRFTGISIDSRTIRPGEVFFAIRGQIHDGHSYIRDAWKKGAALSVMDRKASIDAGKLAPAPVLLVEDTLSALQSLAAHWREKHPVPSIAVVGSVGKTTTKEMLAAVLSTAGPCLRNPGNYNNEIGLPLSMMDLADHYRYAVFEIGANNPGEIRHLSRLLRPRAAVLTRLGWAHLEGFGSPEVLVAEKGSVLEELPGDGWCALSVDDPSHDELRRKARCQVVTYGFGAADVTARDLTLSARETTFVLSTPAGRGKVHLGAFGRHFVENALAAVAAALPLGVSPERVVSGLTGWKPVRQRGGILEPMEGVRFIDDTYNANPLSVQTALESLAHLSHEGVTVAVLGEMKELGRYSSQGHVSVGEAAARLGIDYLIAVGPVAELIAEGAARGGMESPRIMVCPTDREAVRALRPLLTKGVWVLFKGSRAARMESIMEAFLPGADQKNPGGE
ncbi:MAG: UDP-N-acetylmuramoyl-tripeptide--D-alanyl-D-alanine ligase [bacterium]|nr:MAG: UDP-N-acetylmuramoyl-tripeptide--D-alanyl-D-alanine ligase [bacterium]